jgi:hypothetical protein
MLSPRTTLVEKKRFQGKDRAITNSRAATKMGAVVAARMSIATFIPIRDQVLVDAKIKDTERLFNVWQVTIDHQESVSPK